MVVILVYCVSLTWHWPVSAAGGQCGPHSAKQSVLQECVHNIALGKRSWINIKLISFLAVELLKGTAELGSEGVDYWECSI